jgi:hypothetical protein
MPTEKQLKYWNLLSERMKGNKNSLGKHWKIKDTSKFKNPKTEKWKDSIRGENNYRWIKDRTKIKNYWDERNNPEYKQWRYQVFKRDRHICRINNNDCYGEVVAHHILSWRDFPELRYEVKNGITLCLTHHPRKRLEENNSVLMFQKINKSINLKI